jgi:hypothetical protein
MQVSDWEIIPLGDFTANLHHGQYPHPSVIPGIERMSGYLLITILPFRHSGQLLRQQKSFIVSRQWSDKWRREVYAGERLPLDNS